MMRLMLAVGLAFWTIQSLTLLAAEPTKRDYVTAYFQLRALFPVKNPGRGIDRGGEAEVVADQPMTYGLILSAESLRLRTTGGEDKRRVREACRWLVDNSRLAEDGEPGWGLPFAWSHRPKNTPYTITTAIVVEGLLDALALPIWSSAEADEMRTLIWQVHARWNRDLRAVGYEGIYYGYSPEDMSPSWFCVNAPSMYLGAMARFLKEQKPFLKEAQCQTLRRDLDNLASAIVQTVTLRDGAPYWDYITQPNILESKRPNDLIHQAYILWGIEAYRDTGGTVRLPWTRAKAVESLDRFWKDDRLRFFAQDEESVKIGNREEPANLWGVGMLLACYAKWGDESQTRRCYDALLTSYGPYPKVRVLPRDVSDDDQFYPRDAAHVLFGIAQAAYAE